MLFLCNLYVLNVFAVKEKSHLWPRAVYPLIGIALDGKKDQNERELQHAEILYCSLVKP
jgi:hypothetical protein